MLLGVLFGSTLTHTNYLALKANLGGKDFIMLRSGASHKLIGYFHITIALQKLLQTSFVVRINTISAHIIDFRLHHS